MLKSKRESRRRISSKRKTNCARMLKSSRIYWLVSKMARLEMNLMRAMEIIQIEAVIGATQTNLMIQTKSARDTRKRQREKAFSRDWNRLNWIRKSFKRNTTNLIMS